MKRIIAVLLSLVLLAGALSACGAKTPAAGSEDGKLSVVATIFPAYDFARAVAGDKAQLTMLLPPGSEIHSYEPTPQDIIKIQNCDVFIYNGGESDEWVDDVLSSIKNDMTVVRMTDCVTQVTEETKEGMYVHEEAEEGDEPEYDEHVWTSPVNAEKISAAIEKALAAKDPENAPAFQANQSAFAAKLENLDGQFRDIVSHSKRKTLVFADRFPVRYFTEEYGLDYFAAYPGCAEDSEPSARTVSYLINKVKEENIPYVLYIEFSNEKMADTVCEDTGCGKLLFHSCHNITKSDFENGVTYLDIMSENLETVRKALN